MSWSHQQNDQPYDQNNQAYYQNDHSHYQNDQSYYQNDPAYDQSSQAYYQNDQAYDQNNQVYYQNYQASYQNDQSHYQNDQSYDQIDQSYDQNNQAYQQDASKTELYLRIYIFRGEPDCSFNRHVIAEFQSVDDPSFYQSIHVKRLNKESPWRIEVVNGQAEWVLTKRYIGHCDGGYLWVNKGEETRPVEIMTRVEVTNRSEVGGWNCQHFLFEGFQKLVDEGIGDQEWYYKLERTLVDCTFDGAIG
ncbi:hypothetical protein F5Y10DRAFT_285458 [Nemania abortiva]|nr:hypothetical protein F5Y10DRAFT_285458 [Nemania abortiva]